ncbi:hypothetical protein BDK51DRAFT_21282, partial [Blyttiomyces helicus]
NNDGGQNPGHNLFVTGLSHRTRDEDLEDVFGKYGKISKCAIMYDPHSKESRGFAFVSFEDVACADAARENISSKLELHGRILVVERAKRQRARTPTPGQYHGPPKRGTSLNPSTSPYTRNQTHHLFCTIDFDFATSALPV